MAVIQTREYERVYLEQPDQDARPWLTKPQIKALEKIERVLPKKAFEWRRNSVAFRSLVGVIPLGKDALEILPKIYGREGVEGQDSSRQMLLTMLTVVRKLRIKQSAISSMDIRRSSLLDFLILHFCETLHREIQNGMIRLYREEEDNLPVVRGKIEWTEDFKRNRLHRERVYCRYDEFTSDNIYNRILKRVLLMLETSARSMRSQRMVRELLFHFQDVREMPVTGATFSGLHFDRQTERFSYLFELAEIFFSGQTPDVVTGGSRSIATLFDMNELFEEFIGKLTQKEGRRLGLKVSCQGPSQYLLREIESVKHRFLLKPDIILEKARKPVCIIDTKWKRLDTTKSNYGVSQADIYQMFAYAKQYRCDNIILLYPQTSASGVMNKRLKVREGGETISLFTVDMSRLVSEGPKAFSAYLAREVLALPDLCRDAEPADNVTA